MITRHPRRATELVAGGALVLAVALVLAACSVTSSEPGVAGPNSLPPAAASSALSPPTTPSSTAVAASPIVIERLWSPENAVAEMNGSGASPGAVVTVDDETQTDASFDFGTDGAFTMRVQILDEGAHTVCVDDACGRVYTRAIDAESIEEVEAKIDEAIVLARERFDFEAALPEWRIEVAGPMSGTGGSTDAENKTIVIHSNRDRSLDEYVVTVLHEWGHAVDAEWMSDEDRVAYRALRGIDASTEWREPGVHQLDTWGLQPSEDFAEVMAAYWTGGEHVPRTEQLAPAPDDAIFAAVVELLDGRT
ncbi:MAG: hypothetical protein AAGA42_22645 [Actinomycetota bacterium]